MSEANGQPSNSAAVFLRSKNIQIPTRSLKRRTFFMISLLKYFLEGILRNKRLKGKVFKSIFFIKNSGLL